MATHNASNPDSKPSVEARSSGALDRLSQELYALGAETPQERRARRILPWVGSVATHVALILAGFLIPWSTRMLLSNEPEAVAVIADFYELAPGDPNATSTTMEGVESEDFTKELEAETIDVPLPERDLLENLTTDVPTVGPLSNSDALSGFAPSGGGDSVTFGGLRGSNARNIVYIVDASGSMLTYLPIVTDELIRSIDRLTETQNFAVIFFQRNEAILVPTPDAVEANGRRRTRPRLMPATDENKLHVAEWIDLDNRNIRAVGKSNPIAAIKLALEQLQPDPDVIFILSTDITGVGEFEVDQTELLELIDRSNRDRRGGYKAVIKTLQFIDEDPLETLKQIAARNGGMDGYKFLSRDELGIE